MTDLKLIFIYIICHHLFIKNVMVVMGLQCFTTEKNTLGMKLRRCLPSAKCVVARFRSPRQNKPFMYASCTMQPNCESLKIPQYQLLKHGDEHCLMCEHDSCNDVSSSFDQFNIFEPGLYTKDLSEPAGKCWQTESNHVMQIVSCEFRKHCLYTAYMTETDVFVYAGCESLSCSEHMSQAAGAHNVQDAYQAVIFCEEENVNVTNTATQPIQFNRLYQTAEFDPNDGIDAEPPGAVAEAPLQCYVTIRNLKAELFTCKPNAVCIVLTVESLSKRKATYASCTIAHKSNCNLVTDTIAEFNPDILMPSIVGNCHICSEYGCNSPSDDDASHYLRVNKLDGIAYMTPANRSLLSCYQTITNGRGVTKIECPNGDCISAQFLGKQKTFSYASCMENIGGDKNCETIASMRFDTKSSLKLLDCIVCNTNDCNEIIEASDFFLQDPKLTTGSALTCFQTGEDFFATDTCPLANDQCVLAVYHTDAERMGNETAFIYSGCAANCNRLKTNYVIEVFKEILTRRSYCQACSTSLCNNPYLEKLPSLFDTKDGMLDTHGMKCYGRDENNFKIINCASNSACVFAVYEMENNIVIYAACTRHSSCSDIPYLKTHRIVSCRICRTDLCNDISLSRRYVTGSEKQVQHYSATTTDESDLVCFETTSSASGKTTCKKNAQCALLIFKHLDSQQMLSVYSDCTEQTACGQLETQIMMKLPHLDKAYCKLCNTNYCNDMRNISNIATVLSYQDLNETITPKSIFETLTCIATGLLEENINCTSNALCVVGFFVRNEGDEVTNYIYAGCTLTNKCDQLAAIIDNNLKADIRPLACTFCNQNYCNRITNLFFYISLTDLGKEISSTIRVSTTRAMPTMQNEFLFDEQFNIRPSMDVTIMKATTIKSIDAMQFLKKAETPTKSTTEIVTQRTTKKTVTKVVTRLTLPTKHINVEDFALLPLTNVVDEMSTERNVDDQNYPRREMNEVYGSQQSPYEGYDDTDVEVMGRADYPQARYEDVDFGKYGGAPYSSKSYKFSPPSPLVLTLCFYIIILEKQK